MGRLGRWDRVAGTYLPPHSFPEGLGASSAARTQGRRVLGDKPPRLAPGTAAEPMSGTVAEGSRSPPARAPSPLSRAGAAAGDAAAG